MRKFMKHDYITVCNWMVKREMKPPPYHTLPPTGLILDSVACGFMIKTDNGVGILDFFISNPEAPKSMRYAALDEIASCLIERAKRDGIKQLKCDTSIESIYRLAIKHEFHAVGSFKSMVRGL